jgi:hypothetical protein
MTRAHGTAPIPGAASPADPRTPFERFRDLTRRILTTPKSELVKEPAPAATPAKGKRKRGRDEG